MRSELLQASAQSQRQGQPHFKSTKLKLNFQIFNRAYEADIPIFEKSSFQYDKYQLSKIISFQEFQLLFRPFKANSAFRKAILWRKVELTSAFLLLLIPLSLLLMIGHQEDQQFKLIYVIAVMSFLVLNFIPLFISQVVYNRALSELQTYTQSLADPRVQISLQSPPGNSYCTKQFSHFNIKSRKELVDDNYIKLYPSTKNQIFAGINNSLEKPLLLKKHFQFDESQLEKITSFDEVQIALRPFKDNQNYKHQRYYLNILMVFMFTIFLILLCLIPGPEYKDLMILLMCVYSLFYYVILFWLFFKLTKIRNAMILDFQEYCRKISLKDQYKEIFIHLREKRQPRDRITKCLVNLCNSIYCTTKTQQIYCIEIRKKYKQEY